jgi:glutamate-5-semialdehyde dehydrogenase
MNTTKLERLKRGMIIPFGGDQTAVVSKELAAAFRPGDQLLVIQESGALLRIPAAERALVDAAVGQAAAAFEIMAAVPDADITMFFAEFAARLADDAIWARIAATNARDVAAARDAGRPVTRLEATDSMRRGMIAGLLAWRDAAPARGRVLERIAHPGWVVEQVAAPLGVVGFVFEGRPNVFADAAGVLRSGNTAVFRIGSDALETARAILRLALAPALAAAGLPAGALGLIESADRAAGLALFSDRRLALAVARGSGQAVAQLGSVARQAGIAVSLHGTGGAWIVAAADAEPGRFGAAVLHSLDRKVCNTLNVCCIVREAADTLVPIFLLALKQAGEARGHGCKLHVLAGSERYVPERWRDVTVTVRRAEGDRQEKLVDVLPEQELGREWEWEQTPEATLVVVDGVEDAVALHNRYSPRFIASLISEDKAAHELFFQAVEAPFVGDGFTRWVDGQYALNQPELGLSNWQQGRLLARAGILSGNGVYTVRSRVVQTEIRLRR